MNDLGSFARVFDGITPCSGEAPAGHVVDFLGTVTPEEFLPHDSLSSAADRPRPVHWGQPALGGGRNGEFWFEAVDWVLAARDARDRFVMATLGAFYGYQAIGSCRALTLLNPTPYQLVAVEPLAEKLAGLRRHMRINGIDPDRQWLIQAVLAADNEPVLFPVGAPNVAGHNCIATNEPSVRKEYLHRLVAEGRTEEALSNLLLRNATGIKTGLGTGKHFTAEVKYVSCVTLGDVLGPLDFVDYVEADLQQSEMLAFPPFMDLLRQRVRRIHIGTHGADVHHILHRLFAERGWEIVFSYAPDSTHDSPAGPFTTNDGVLTVRNPGF